MVAATRVQVGWDEVARQLTVRLIKIGLVIAVPMAAATFVVAPSLIQAVLGPGYAGAVAPTRILVWFLPFAAVEAPLLGALAGSGHASDTTKVFAATFATAIAMHLCLDWWLGATGGAIASLSRDPVGLAVTFVLARRAGLIGTGRSRLAA